MTSNFFYLLVELYDSQMTKNYHVIISYSNLNHFVSSKIQHSLKRYANWSFHFLIAFASMCTL